MARSFSLWASSYACCARMSARGIARDGGLGPSAVAGPAARGLPAAAAAAAAPPHAALGWLGGVGGADALPGLRLTKSSQSQGGRPRASGRCHRGRAALDRRWRHPPRPHEAPAAPLP